MAKKTSSGVLVSLLTLYHSYKEYFMTNPLNKVLFGNPKGFLDAKWKEILESFLEGDDITKYMDGTPAPAKVENFRIVLENMKRNVEQMALHSQSGNFSPIYWTLVFPAMKRIFPNIIAHEICGVQSMTDAVCKINFKGTEEIIETRTRRLSARWLPEQVEKDIKSCELRGVDVDVEIEYIAALSQEICAELDQELLCTLRNTFGQPKVTFDMTTKYQYPSDENPKFVGDVCGSLETMIMNEAKTLPAGEGNRVVISPTALTILQSSPTHFKVRDDYYTSAPTNTRYVGTLGNANVYVNQYASDNTPVLICHKGSEDNAAIIYSPYAPISTCGLIVDPNTFDTMYSFMTRYGLYRNPEPADYVTGVGIEMHSLGFV
jgi:hypothetical protein